MSESVSSTEQRVLIANRGECASRLIRAFHELKIETIAVFSEADRNAPFVKAATHSFLLGASPASESYLRVDRLLDAGRQLGATAVHPGWGFLSENPDFPKLSKPRAGFLSVPLPSIPEIWETKSPQELSQPKQGSHALRHGRQNPIPTLKMNSKDGQKKPRTSASQSW